jgi:SAM-dependent methyltransferase
VRVASEGYECAECARLYPFVFGIPDFRISLPAHFDLSRDTETARVLVESEKDLDFEGLLHLYYRLNPEPGEDLHDKHMAHLAGEEDQARAALELIEESREFLPGEAVLEVGCGVGQYLAVAAERADHVAGVDLCLPFLVLTRKRLGPQALLAAADAGRLPFRDGAFAAVIAADVIEHLADPQQSLAEMGRVLVAGGPLFLSTPNRFSLSPEPHVGLWGVGYLPRRLANRYVLRRRRICYDDVRLLSARSLSRMLHAHFPGRARLLIPALSPRQLQHFPPLKRRLAEAYLALRRVPLLRGVFYCFGPFFQVVAEKR